MSLRKAGFILLVLCSLFFANSNSNVDLGYLVPITAITVSIFLAGMYMLSQSISNPMLEAWTKTELRELIAGVILLAITYSFLFSANNATKILTGEDDYIGGSQKIINNILTGYDNAYKDVIRAGGRLRVAATYSPWISIPAWYVSFSYSASPMGGIAPLFAPLTQATQGLANNIFIFESILMLIKISRVSVQLVLLPLAFVIRMIPFTRNVGNTLIAVSIGALVFLPFSIYVVDVLHSVITYPVPKLTSSNLDDLDFTAHIGAQGAISIAEPFCQIQFIRFVFSLSNPGFAALICLAVSLACGPYWSVCFAACYPIISEVVYPIMTNLFQVVYTLALIVFFAATNDGSAYAESAFNALYTFTTNLNHLIVMGYLDVVLIALITMSGIKSVSSALGGEWYLAGIQRLI